MSDDGTSGSVAPPSLERLIAERFKSLRDRTELEVRNFTVLAGANSSGKSSILQPLLLLKQTLEARFDPGPLRLDGDNLFFSRADQLTWDDAKAFVAGFGARSRTIELRFEVESGHRTPLALVSETLRLEDPSGPSDVTLCEGPLDDRVRERLASLEKPAKTRPRRSRTPQEVYRDRCYLLPAWRLDSRAEAFVPSPEVRTFPFVLPLYVIHVPGVRGNPQRWYQLTEVGERFPGRFDEYTATVIYHWQQNKDQRLNRLGEWLKKLGLTWKVTAEKVGDTRVLVRVGRLPRARRGGARDLVDLADVGFGVSQVLPVLTGLLAADRRHVVYLEQPELHLHPRAQVVLAGILAERVRDGVTVVAETHSSLLLRGLQRVVAEGQLDPALVKLHWFTRDPEGATTVYSADLDHAGRFGDWPEDFAEVELEAEAGYITAAERALARG